MNIMHTMASEARTAQAPKRRFSSPELKLQVIGDCAQPGASIAGVAISNSRLISMDEHGVTFRWKDYRANGKTRQKTMTLEDDEFMRQFLLHVLRHHSIIDLALVNLMLRCIRGPGHNLINPPSCNALR